jgi:hypothetical protein
MVTRFLAKVWFLMSYVNSHRAGRRVYIWSDVSRSTFSGWHKMW